MEESLDFLWDAYLDLLCDDRVTRLIGKQPRRMSPDEREDYRRRRLMLLAEDPDILYWKSPLVREDPALREEFEALLPYLREARQQEPRSRLTLSRLRKRRNRAESAGKAFDLLEQGDFLTRAVAEMDAFVREDASAFFAHLCPEGGKGKKRRSELPQPLSLTGAAAFFEQFEGDSLFLYLEFEVFLCRMEKRLFMHLGRVFPELRQADEQHDKVFHDSLERAVESLMPAYREKLREALSMRTILDRLSSHRAYRKPVSQYRQLLRIRSEVLKAIPEHYRDLYPSARAMHRHFCLHIGPTNSGKTYDAVTRLEESGNGVYLAPLRLLAYEQFDTINHDGVACSLLTGEEDIPVACAKITASTIEMANLHRHYAVAVIDEAQMITDADRGGSWSAAILGILADEVHVCASPDAEELLSRIIRSCGDELEVVRHERATPLVAEDTLFRFPQDVMPGDALIVFSKRSVHAVAAELQKEKKTLRPSLVYGALPYEVRHEEARRFRDRETDVVVATDAIGMGLNLPIRRIVFMETVKFDGVERRDLTVSEIKQIAGRAGRYGLYDTGYVTSCSDREAIAEALSLSPEPLASAVIAFPETLLGIDAPLTQILQRWNDVKGEEGWNKAKTERMLFLAQRMEKTHTDKAFLFRFISIPFDETDADLLAMWEAMYQSEEYGEHLDLMQLLPEPVSEEELLPVASLDRLEAEYRVCDLCANYLRLFLKETPEHDRLREEIDSRKNLLSRAIMRILATRKLKGKTCRRCGRTIPWNYPYSLCEKCFHSGSYGAWRKNRNR